MSRPLASALIASFRRILAASPTPPVLAAGQTPQQVLHVQTPLPPPPWGPLDELCRSCGSYIPHGPRYYHKLNPAHPLFDGNWRVQTLCTSCRVSWLTPSTVPPSSRTSLPAALPVDNPAAAKHVRKPTVARTRKLPKPVDGPNAAFLARSALQRAAAEPTALEALERAARETASPLATTPLLAASATTSLLAARETASHLEHVAAAEPLFYKHRAQVLGLESGAGNEERRGGRK
jgi:hypothetical protein